MSGTHSKTVKIPEIVIEMIGDHVMELARYLREIQDDQPGDFEAVAKSLKIGRRKAFYLAKINRTFHNLGIDIEQLRPLGWTKLALLAPYVDEGNVETLLALTKIGTVHELKMRLEEKPFDPEGKTVVLHLGSEQFALFEHVLVAFGAVKHARGLLNKEEALTRLLSANLPI